MKRLTATLGEYSYPITTAAGSFNDPASFLPPKPGDRVMLVTNETLTPLYLDAVHSVLKQAGVNVDSMILPDDEQYKSLAVMDTVSTALSQKPYGRDTTLMALGGGVIDGLAGFATAGYQRGVRFIRVPITLLSQVDSSVGDKVAVNHPLGKNMIDAFWQPVPVTADPNCLRALPARELASGLVEVIKHGMILNGEFFSWLKNNTDVLLVLDEKVIACCIRRCYELKAEAVAADGRETGLRALLNLRHTFGHAIEAKMGYGNWLYGEAVVASMVMATHTPEWLGQFRTQDTQRIIDLLKCTGLPVRGPQEMSAQTYSSHMMHGKKVLVGDTRLVLPLAVGSNELRGGVPHDVVLNVIADTQQT